MVGGFLFDLSDDVHAARSLADTNHARHEDFLHEANRQFADMARQLVDLLNQLRELDRRHADHEPHATRAELQKYVVESGATIRDINETLAQLERYNAVNDKHQKGCEVWRASVEERLLKLANDIEMRD
jgi:succinate dehydrogenase/fumarate reductase flavoprotein subunit